MFPDLLGVLAAAFAGTALLTPVVRFAARRFGLVVAPRVDRWHTTPTALFGGVAIVLGAAAGWGVMAVTGSGHFQGGEALAILAAAGVMFVLGLVDDARGIGPVGKFILQLAAATILVTAGVVYPLSPWTPVNVLVTLFWFVGITNAMNLLDNMDGVSAGVSAVAAAGFAILFALSGNLVLAGLALGVAGAAAAFLLYNFRPASIFMGDSGSLFLGACLAGLGAAYPLASGTVGPVAVLVPALLLIVPIADTTLVTVTRVLHDRRISVGGRDHTTHRLVAMGLSEARAALALYACGATAVLVAWYAAGGDAGAGLWMGILFTTGALLFTGYLGTLYRYEDGGSVAATRHGVMLRHMLLKRRGLVVILDCFLFGAAYYGAYVIYHEARMPAHAGATANATLGVVIVLKVFAFHYFHVYRTVWENSTLPDIHRVARATVLGSLLVVAALFLLMRGEAVPRTVFVLDFLLTVVFATGARMSFRSLERLRRRLRPAPGAPALVYGVDAAEGDLVLRAIAARQELGLCAVGFVTDDPELSGQLVHGLPVVGSGPELEALVARGGAEVMISAASELTPDALAAFAGLGLRVLRFRAEFAPVTPAVTLLRVASAAARHEPASGVGG